VEKVGIRNKEIAREIKPKKGRYGMEIMRNNAR